MGNPFLELGKDGKCMKKEYTIKEAVDITGKSKSTIYRHINNGKLNTFSDVINGQEVTKVLVEDLERVFNINGNGSGNGNGKVSHDKVTTSFPGFPVGNGEGKTLEQVIQENVNIAIEKTLSQHEVQLMKPMEEHALFVAGTLTNENKFLKQRLETLLAENDELRNAMKALPGPVEEVVSQLTALSDALTKKEQLEQDMQEKIEALTKLKQERETLQAEQARVLAELEKLQGMVSESESLKANYNKLQTQLNDKNTEISALEQEKAEIISKLEAENNELRETIDGNQQRIQDLEANVEEECNQKVILHKSLVKVEEQNKELQAKAEAEAKEKEELQNKLVAEEKDYMATIEELKKRLEEEKKPWWKRIFS